MAEQPPTEPTTDAAAQRSPQQRATRTEPWTGQGPIIRNLPDPSQPYGASPVRTSHRPARKTIVPWFTVAIIVALVVIAAIVLLAFVL